LALDGGQWSDSHHGHFTKGGKEVTAPAE